MPHRSRVRLAISILFAAAVVLFPGCRPNESVEGQARDAKIKTQIKSKLASEIGAATVTSVEVNVTNGVVTLAGPVHNEDEKTRAESSARSVEGVVSVTNALQILGGGPPSALTAAVSTPLRALTSAPPDATPTP